MIEWIKFDPENPPTAEKDYFVSDGPHADIAMWMDNQWYVPDRSSIDGPNITHWAPINLPREETTDVNINE
jgi:hypothetical protein